MKDIPIRSRLLLHAVLATGIALVLSGAAAIYTGDRAARGDLEQDLVIRADILAGNLTAALMFDDPEEGNKVLAPLASDPGVAYAVAYDAEGDPFAFYYRDAESASGSLRAPAAEIRFESDFLALLHQ